MERKVMKKWVMFFVSMLMICMVSKVDVGAATTIKAEHVGKSYFNNGKATPSIIVNGKTLKKDVDFKMTSDYKKEGAIPVGTKVKYTINGMGSYKTSGALIVTRTVQKYDIRKAYFLEELCSKEAKRFRRMENK